MTAPFRSVRRADELQRLEIDTWPDLDKIRFEFAVRGKGQGIIGPMIFGRAYDSPPFFSHSIVAEAFYQSGPQLTIGVADWIRDEQGHYVGANLWVRLDSTWCNTPRRSSEACTEPLILGDNILRDPGFEFHNANVPIGPVPMTIPGDGFSAGGNPGSLRWNTDLVEGNLYYDLNGWAVWSNNFGVLPGSGEPVISTANPRSGTYHWRVTYLTGASFGSETYPIPIGGRYCELRTGLIQGYSARVEPGLTVRYSQYMMVSNTTDGPFNVNREIAFYDADFVQISSVVPSPIALTTSYVKHEVSTTAPANAFVCVAEFDIENSYELTLSPTHFDVDDCVLEVSHS